MMRDESSSVFEFLFSEKFMLIAVVIAIGCVAVLILIRKKKWAGLKDLCILLIVFVGVYLAGVYVLDAKLPKIAEMIRGTPVAAQGSGSSETTDADADQDPITDGTDTQ